MKSHNPKCNLFISALVTLMIMMQTLAGPLAAQSGGIGADGLTFWQRKQQWLDSLPQPSSGMSMVERRKYMLSWLESGTYNRIVSEVIQDFVGDFWYGGIRSQGAFAVMILLKHGSRGSGLISSEDENVIRTRIEKSITESDFFEHLNPNKQLFAMACTYLYTSYYGQDLRFPLFGHRVDRSEVPDYFRDQWPDFSYNGHNYEFGAGSYNAFELSRDWLFWRFETWFAGTTSPPGNREFDSPIYAFAFPLASALLWAMAPESDEELKRRSKMATDIMLLDSVLDYSANSWGGTMGRTQYWLTARAPIFPFHHWWGMGDVLDGGPEKWEFTATYHIGYVPPDVIIDAGALEDESDRYWHFHKEYNPNSLLHRVGRGKWNWVTKNYNIGSSDGHDRMGWQANVRGNGREAFIRFWINQSATAPSHDQENPFLGQNGRQFRNAIFADVGSTPHLWERKVGANWQQEEEESGWLFKKLGKSMVAIGIGSRTASVELATEGVEYSSWAAFKNAVKTNASLTDSYYITSSGQQIGKTDYCGLNLPGDVNFPFQRMETVLTDGSKMVSWNNNVLTVSVHGNTFVYDFNNWTFNSENSAGDVTPPAAPAGVRVSNE